MSCEAAEPVKLDDISEWGRSVFEPNNSDQAVALRVLEECVEACYSAGIGFDQINVCSLMTLEKCRRKQAEKDTESVIKELGDVIVTAVNAIWQRGFDPNRVLGDLLKKLKARMWNRKADGTYQHVEG